MGAIERSDLSPDRIVFEVTESEEIEDDKHLRSILNFYRRSGFRVALDDLDAGYSSLNRLTASRPDFVKLSPSLIRDVERNPYQA